MPKINPAANNSVIGTKVLHTLGFPACIKANTKEEIPSAHHRFIESIKLFNKYPRNTISSSNAATNNIRLTIIASCLNATVPVTVIAPKSHKIKKIPPINNKAVPSPANISFSRSLSDNPIFFSGSLLITTIINQIAKKLDNIDRIAKASILGDAKSITANPAIHVSMAA